MKTRWLLPIALAVLVGSSTIAFAAVGGERGSGGPWEPAPPSEDIEIPRGEAPCPDRHPDWREAQTVMGVPVQADPHCQPDNPELVATYVKGTNNVNASTLDRLALNDEAVVKCCDRDGDGDPDVINVTLEVLELNGFHLRSDDLATPFNIAPGIHPTFWVFAPKGTIEHAGEAFRDVARMPTPPLRFEVGDEVNIELENTHYFPHTIHLHGVDHPYQDEDGEGNDGVPTASEAPIRPGESRTYNFQARQPGTMFYHCHVQPDVHVAMGLGGIIRIEEDRANNTLQTVNPGAGLVRHPAKAVEEQYDKQYDVQYQNIDKELHEIPQRYNDPRVLAREMNRVYDSTERDVDYFLMNGRMFPYTLRESMITVQPDQEVLVHMINAGEETHSIHTHGHKPTVVAEDGVPVPEEARSQRDVFTITAAQRLDLVLNTTNDGRNSYGPGVWFWHDHIEKAVTTDGISPGGDISLITYDAYMNDTTAMPEPGNGSWDLFFTEAYYRGEIPVWHRLDMPWLFGQVDTSAATEDDDSQTIPGLGPIAAMVALTGTTLAVARTRREGLR